MKLHLGCGTKHLEGYTNIDIRYLVGWYKTLEDEFTQEFMELFNYEVKQEIGDRLFIPPVIGI